MLIWFIGFISLDVKKNCPLMVNKLTFPKLG